MCRQTGQTVMNIPIGREYVFVYAEMDVIIGDEYDFRSILLE